MISEGVVWSILLLPLVSFVLISLVVRPFLNRVPIISGLCLIICLLISLALSVNLLLILSTGSHLTYQPHHWLDVGSVSIEIGLLVDPLTAVMLVVVTAISLLVQIYSLGYMKGDSSFCRYYAYMSLFTGSMIGLVLASNIVQLYAFWELVGVSSYLLIGFWHHRPAAAAAAKKAFIITRIGDVGFLLGIIYLYLHADAFSAVGLNVFHIPDIWQAASPIVLGGAGILGGIGLTWLTLGIFAGAAGKSGQFPLHTWLPDAMEGPTPVSALIHAATMVAAGVFLVARFYPVFEQSQTTLMVVVIVGAVTAVLASTMGLVVNDIKRVMAYSTISQLGYMMAALGLGAFGAAIFHLFTHAIFKALLFLCSGSVNHAVGTFNMQYMGGLRKHMPWTYFATLIGVLSLVGIIPLAGFWSKDEILTSAFWGSGILGSNISWMIFGLLLSGVLITAFYSFRLIHLTFHGTFRGGGIQEIADAEELGVVEVPGVSDQVHLKESPAIMVIPLVLLGAGSLSFGYLANPQWVERVLFIPKHWITEFVIESLPGAVHIELAGFNLVLAVISNIIGLVGIALATWMYLGRRYGTSKQVKDPITAMGPIYRLLSKKYYLDYLYEEIFVRNLFYRGIVTLADYVDRYVIDGIFDSVAAISKRLARYLSRGQTGQVQVYGLVAVLGSVLILVGYVIYGLEL
ncbi:MAG: NADH-quinone oxidoreductase subunit L [Chloroflexota bacterium]|nr:NADH-quinone oxidoreductase subunit L [Chloroflexota bacterium]